MAGFTIPDLAAQMEMGVVRFRDLGDSLYLIEGEMLKIYQPRSVRRLGGRPDERYMSGAICMAIKAEVPDLTPQRKRLATPPSLTFCPIMNFGGIPIVDIIDGAVPPEFTRGIKRYLGAMPCSLAEMDAALGRDFLSKSGIDRCVAMVDYLRTLPEADSTH